MKAITWFLAVLNLMFIAGLSAADVTLEGIIEVAEEDEDYQPVEISLMVDTVVSGQFRTYYYIIDPSSGKGRELFEKIDKKVRVTGSVRTDRDGARRLTVQKYQSMPPVPGEKEEGASDSLGMEGKAPAPGDSGSLQENGYSEDEAETED